MRKLIGKIRQAFRKWLATAPSGEVMMGKREYRKYLRRRRPGYEARAYVTHYRAKGELRFLCGRPVESDSARHRPAHSTQDLMCNRCQVIHNKLLTTPGGRQRLGVDKYEARPVTA